MKKILLFVHSSAFILLFTAIAKFISGIGAQKVLVQHDPIFSIQFRLLFELAAMLEFVVAFLCFKIPNNRLTIFLIAWLSTVFTAYRIGLWMINWQRPCPCLGNLTDMIHISPYMADAAMKIILGYLLIGSYLSFFLLWKEKQKNLAWGLVV